MAINIITQPFANKVCSTLIPLKFRILENTLSTTNILAECYYITQTGAPTNIQIGPRFRMAPDIDLVDYFNFDASEIYNSLTKYNLNDWPGNYKLGSTTVNSRITDFDDIATFKVFVRFYREYVDSSGLIVVDPAYRDSNTFFVHEGSPPQSFINAFVRSNGLSNSVFDIFDLRWQSAGPYQKRFLSNRPIYKIGSRYANKIDIHENEQFPIAFFTPDTTLCGYQLKYGTRDSSGALLNTHETTITENRNLQLALVGFADLKSGYTPNAAEGTNFANVHSYTVVVEAGTNSSLPCLFTLNSTELRFTVKRGCTGKGYLNFCFKNMLGGYDSISSYGSYIKKTKNKFEDYEKSLLYDNWDEQMEFGDNNFNNLNTIAYSVTTHAMGKKDAEHFAEMFSSVSVYLRYDNDAINTFQATPDQLETNASDPYYFSSIKIDNGTQEILRTTKNLYKLKFSFSKSINQRNPRY